MNQEDFSLPMSEIKITGAIFLVTFVLVKLLNNSINRKRYKLPPGPRGVPFLGYIPFLGKEPPVTFTEMRKTYGDVISITLGSFPAVIINGKETIKEALVMKGDDFSGRPAFTLAHLANDGRNFAVSAFGPIWKMHRKIVHNVMHAFGNARNNPIEQIVSSEANLVVDQLLAHSEQSFRPSEDIFMAANSMIYQVCFGYLVNIREDKDFTNSMEDAKKVRKFASSGNPVDVIPWLRYVMPWKVSFVKTFLKGLVERRSKKVAEHEATFDEKNLRDITDGLIDAGNKLSQKEKDVGLDKRRVVESLDVIMNAGGSTVSSVLDWSILLMAAHPEIQEKVFQQISSVVGQSRQPLLSDRPDLPLVEATLLEVLRFSSVSPIGFPHCTTRDTTLNGFDIPEGTVVITNLYSVNVDEKLWGDPQNFRPERFLDADGHVDTNASEQFIPFGLGRRRCIGEFLAQMEIFLFFTTMIQRCKIFKPPGAPDYKMNRVFTLVCEPEPFKICAVSR